jgi:hypothetical protein
MMGRLQMRSQKIFLTGLLVSSFLVFSSLTPAAQATEPAREAHPAVSSSVSSPVLTAAPPPSISRTVTSDRGAMMYRRLWGVDELKLKATSSGALIRFSFRVVDANKAKVLNDKKVAPILTDETTGARLEVPIMEKVGQLRQTATPQNGREYWMVFLNRSHLVKPGSRVAVEIGNFRVSGLVVE